MRDDAVGSISHALYKLVRQCLHEQAAPSAIEFKIRSIRKEQPIAGARFEENPTALVCKFALDSFVQSVGRKPSSKGWAYLPFKYASIEWRKEREAVYCLVVEWSEGDVDATRHVITGFGTSRKSR